MKKEIRIAGFGGQGMAMAGLLLGKALTLYEDLEAVMTQSYGPEARGGASSANIVMSDEPVDYPFVEQPDVLVMMSQEAYTKFRPTAKADATILIDDSLVVPDPNDMPYCIPATHLAEELGRRIVANVVMLGFFAGITGLASREAMERALESTVKPRTLELNLKAFATGYERALMHQNTVEEHVS